MTQSEELKECITSEIAWFHIQEQNERIARSCAGALAEILKEQDNE